MKKIEAVIRPQKFAAVRAALAEIGISAMTVFEVKGIGQQEGYTEHYRGVKTIVDLLPNLKIELIVDDSLVADCIDVISTAARTGKVGDGKIFISSIEKIIRIRTQEEDEKAV